MYGLIELGKPFKYIGAPGVLQAACCGYVGAVDARICWSAVNCVITQNTGQGVHTSVSSYCDTVNDGTAGSRVRPRLFGWFIPGFRRHVRGEVAHRKENGRKHDLLHRNGVWPEFVGEDRPLTRCVAWLCVGCFQCCACECVP
jgi:hypothetical protein